MRRFLTLFLSAVMILSLALVGVSADEATPIASAADFAAMTADGNYKLTKDISVDASWGADPVTPFTGTFDGDGHKITVSAPLFVQFSGTIKNLTIDGAVVKEGTANATASYAGTIANQVPANSENVLIENITVNASVTFAYRGGSLIGQISSGSTVTIKDCVNNATISGGNMAGGFVGYSQSKGSKKVGDETVAVPSTLTVLNCVNNGNVSIDVSRSLTGLAGGIVGRYGGDDKAYDPISNVIIRNCLNNGNITGTSQAAGILAHARSSNVVIENCTNKGTILSTYTAADGGTSDAAGIFGSTASSDGHYCMVEITRCLNEGNVTSKNARAGGIAGYVWCGGQGDNYLFASIIDCVNKGNVQAGSFGSQFIAYTNDAKAMEEGQKQNTTISGVGLGTVSRCPEAKRETTQFYDCFVGLSSSTKGTNYNINVKLSDADTPDWLTYAEDEKYADDRFAFSARPDTLQMVSAADAEAAVAAIANLGYQASAAPSDPATPVTGDGFIWVIALAAVSLLGMAFALKTVKSD